MIVMHRKDGKWQAFDRNDIIAVYLTANDKTSIAALEDHDNCYMAFDPKKGFTDEFLIAECRRAEALGRTREEKAVSGSEEW